MPDPALRAEVVVYSTPLCEPCEQLKSYLRGRGIAFRVRDLLMDEDAAAELEQRNIWSAPAISVGDEFVEGFDRARVDALLGIPA
jgi:glutaredoxin